MNALSWPLRSSRLQLSRAKVEAINKGLELLEIKAPEKISLRFNHKPGRLGLIRADGRLHTCVVPGTLLSIPFPSSTTLIEAGWTRKWAIQVRSAASPRALLTIHLFDYIGRLIGSK